jgi:hypothetical protein
MTLMQEEGGGGEGLGLIIFFDVFRGTRIENLVNLTLYHRWDDGSPLQKN